MRCVNVRVSITNDLDLRGESEENPMNKSHLLGTGAEIYLQHTEAINRTEQMEA